MMWLRPKGDCVIADQGKICVPSTNATAPIKDPSRISGHQLVADRHITAIPGKDMVETMMVSVPLSGGSWLNFTTPIEIAEPFWSLRFGLSMAIMLSAVAILSAIVVHYLTRPLATFAHAAVRLGIDVKAPPLPEDGPFEVRQATRAFNEMQARIRRFVEDCTQMIAAISHDLGTPITRIAPTGRICRR